MICKISVDYERVRKNKTKLSGYIRTLQSQCTLVSQTYITSVSGSEAQLLKVQDGLKAPLKCN